MTRILISSTTEGNRHLWVLYSVDVTQQLVKHETSIQLRLKNSRPVLSMTVLPDKKKNFYHHNRKKTSLIDGITSCLINGLNYLLALQ